MNAIKESFDNLPAAICIFSSKGLVRLMNRRMLAVGAMLLGSGIQTLGELQSVLKDPPEAVTKDASMPSVYHLPDGSVLDLQCAMFADAITMALERSDPDFRIVRSDTPGKTAALCKSSLAYALIMEVTGYTPWRLEERLRLRDEVKRLRPDCKVLLLAVVCLLSLAACGKDESADVTGKYNCIAIAEDGVNFTAPETDEQYVELKKGGKGEIYTDLAFELTWKLDGENFSGSYQIFGIDAPVTGTLKDGVLEIHDDEMVMRYLKEGAEAPGVVGITPTSAARSSLRSIPSSAPRRPPRRSRWKPTIRCLRSGTVTGTAGGSCTAARAATAA